MPCVVFALSFVPCDRISLGFEMRVDIAAAGATGLLFVLRTRALSFGKLHMVIFGPLLPLTQQLPRVSDSALFLAVDQTYIARPRVFELLAPMTDADILAHTLGCSDRISIQPRTPYIVTHSAWSRILWHPKSPDVQRLKETQRRTDAESGSTSLP